MRTLQITKQAPRLIREVAFAFSNPKSQISNLKSKI